MVWEDYIIGAACVQGCRVIFTEHSSYGVGMGGVGDAVLAGELLGEGESGVGVEEGGISFPAVSLGITSAASGGSRGLVICHFCVSCAGGSDGSMR